MELTSSNLVKKGGLFGALKRNNPTPISSEHEMDDAYISDADFQLKEDNDTTPNNQNNNTKVTSADKTPAESPTNESNKPPAKFNFLQNMIRKPGNKPQEVVNEEDEYQCSLSSVSS